mmetsp:Transcript_1545/g.3424  ORF Transcript_1545/g.3424 Transcript_1545/m.3424 type:complete len:83 (+) Transcript_1545:133-381(+)
MHAYYLHASVHSPRLALQLQVALHGARNVQVVVRVHTAMPISPHKHDHSSPNHLQCSHCRKKWSPLGVGAGPRGGVQQEGPF